MQPRRTHILKPGITFLGLFLLSSFLIWQSAFASVPSETVNIPVHISITSQGFTPPTVTISPGTEVVWTNNTTAEITLVSGAIYPLYLPIIIGGASTTSLTQPESTANAGLMAQTEWGSVLLPGESYHYVFTESGEFPYHLSNFSFAGAVIVTEGASPTSTPTTTLTSTPTATGSPTPSPTVTETASPTATSTSSPTPTSTATPTSSPTPTATPTSTSTPLIGPDLAVSKYDNDIIVTAGGLITYTIAFTNTGSVIASGVILTETLPANTSFNAENSSPGWGQGLTAGSYLYTVGDLDVNVSQIVTFVVTADTPLPPGTQFIHNSVQIGDDGQNGLDPNPGNNSATTSTPVTTGPTNVCGTISQNTTWTRAGSPYLVTCNVTVANNITLAVEPGVTIRVGTNRSFQIAGTLSAQGTAAQPILFTVDSNVPGSNRWTGLDFRPGSGQSVLTHTTVEWTSNWAVRADQANITILNSILRQASGSGLSLTNASPTINYTTIRDNSQYGISISSTSNPVLRHNAIVDNGNYAIHSNTLARPDIDSSNSVSGNGRDAIYIAGSSIQSDFTWNNWGVPYVIGGGTSTSEYVAAGVTLTIEPGLTIYVTPSATFAGYFRVFGTLSAQGTAAQPILFTVDSNVPGSNRWTGLDFRPGSGQSVLTHTTVEWTSNWAVRADQANITILNSILRQASGSGLSLTNASPTINYTTIRDNSQYGISISSTSNPVLRHNAIVDNGNYAIHSNTLARPDIDSSNSVSGNGRDAIYIAGSSIQSDFTWNNWGVPYVIGGGTSTSEYVAAGVTLTIEPGLTIYVTPSATFAGYFRVFGTLSAQGTAAQPILFTVDSNVPGSNRWTGLDFRPGSGQSVLTHTTVEWTSNWAVRADQANITILNSILRQASGSGLSLTNASPTINYTTIRDNSQYGISISSTSNPVLRHNAIVDNGNYAIHSNTLARPDIDSSNSVSGNGRDAIYIAGSSIQSDFTWNNWGVPYVIGGGTSTSEYVAAGVTLTIEPGLTIYVTPSATFAGYFRVFGTLSAQGTAAQPILFTVDSNVPGSNRWTGLDFRPGSGQSVLTHTTVEWTSNWAVRADQANITILNSILRQASGSGLSLTNASPTINYTTIRDNSQYGISISSTSNPVLRHNAIVDNGNYAIHSNTLARPDIDSSNSVSGNGRDAIYIAGSSIQSDFTWNNWGVPYVIGGGTSTSEYVAAGVTLTIEPGLTIYVTPSATFAGYFRVFGTLSAQGTAAQPILFTVDSNVPGSNRWTGLDFRPGSGQSVLTHTTVEWTSNWAVRADQANITILNSILRQASGSGLSVSNSRPLIRFNNIYSNGSYGVSNSTSSVLVDARYNWWGTNSGPQPYGSGNGINGNVLVDPWIGKQVYEDGNALDDALPPEVIRNTALPEPGVPYIVSIEPSLTGMYLLGFPYPVQIMVEVDWNGSDPGLGTAGTVDFHLNNQTVTITGSGTFVTWDVNTSLLRKGLYPQTNRITIVARDPNGVESNGFVYSMQAVDVGAFFWVGNNTYHFDGAVLKYKSTIKIPPEFKGSDTGSNDVPAMQNVGASFNPVEVEIEFTSEGEGSLKIEALFIKAEIAGQKAEIGGSATGTIDLLSDELRLIEIEFEIYGKAKIKTPKVPLPAPLSFLTYHSVIQPEAAASYGLVEYGDGIGPVLPGSLQFANQAELEIKLGIEGVLSIGAGGIANLEGALGGAPVVTLVVPKNPNLPLGHLSKLGGDVWVRATATVLFYEKEWKVVWTCEKDFENNVFACPLISSVEGITPITLYESSDWRIADRSWATSENYAIFGDDSEFGIMMRSSGQAEFSSVETGNTLTLMSNLYPYAKPSMAINGSDAVLLWVHDDPTKLITQSLEIYYSYWNGATWSYPMNVTDDEFVNVDPVVTFDANGNAVAVWSRATAAGSIENPRDILDTYEIVYAVFNANEQSWSTPQALTSNSQMDILPMLTTASDGSVKLIWLHGSAADYPISPDDTVAIDVSLQIREWNGENWSEATILTSGLATDRKVSMIANDISVIAWNIDNDGDSSTTVDREIQVMVKENGTWSSPETITNNSYADVSPLLTQTSDGQPMLIWVREHVTRTVTVTETESFDQLFFTIYDEGEWLPPTLGFEASGINELAITNTPAGQIVLVWQEVSENGLDLYYAVYDEPFNVFGQAQPLVNNTLAKWAFAPGVLDSGQLLIPHLQRDVITTTETITRTDGTIITLTVPSLQQTDLVITLQPLAHDLAVTNPLQIQPENPVPGDHVMIEAIVANKGDFALNDIPVAFYDGDPGSEGILIVSVLVTRTLAPGDSVPVSISWSVPQRSTPITLFAMVDPENLITESDETNNTISATTMLPDLSITAYVAYRDNYQAYPAAIVRNTGVLTATNVPVSIYRESITGTLLISSEIGILPPGSLAVVTTTLDLSNDSAGVYDIIMIVDEMDTLEEVTKDNNLAIAKLSVLPDLVIYAGDIDAELSPDSGGTITITVRNWGTAVAENVTVVLYEGTELTPNATALYTWTVPSLAVDSDGDMQLVTTLDHRPNRLFAIADPANEIDELDESNNIALLTQPISITFRYHDLEQIIPITATVTISGSWSSTPITLTKEGDIYSVSIQAADTPLTYRYIVNGNSDLLNPENRVVTPIVGTTYDDFLLITTGQHTLRLAPVARLDKAALRDLAH